MAKAWDEPATPDVPAAQAVYRLAHRTFAEWYHSRDRDEQRPNSLSCMMYGGADQSGRAVGYDQQWAGQPAFTQPGQESFPGVAGLRGGGF